MDTQKLLKNVLEKEEHHRQLIAYEIHDGIAQYLSAAIMHLEAYRANPSDNPEHDQNMTGALRLLREASRETRHLISGLRPPALDELGIIDSLEMLVADTRLEIKDVHFRGDCFRGNHKRIVWAISRSIHFAVVVHELNHVHFPCVLSVRALFVVLFRRVFVFRRIYRRIFQWQLHLRDHQVVLLVLRSVRS